MKFSRNFSFHIIVTEVDFISDTDIYSKVEGKGNNGEISVLLKETQVIIL